MGLRLSHTTIDASDPYRIAEFWRSLVDWTVQDSESYQPGSDECYLESPDGYTVLFMRCPDQKKVKNRMHFDLVPRPGSNRDEEMHRALKLGAAVLDDRRSDVGWVVMTDLEGNEFCILNE